MFRTKKFWSGFATGALFLLWIVAIPVLLFVFFNGPQEQILGVGLLFAYATAILALALLLVMLIGVFTRALRLFSLGLAVPFSLPILGLMLLFLPHGLDLSAIVWLPGLVLLIVTFAVGLRGLSTSSATVAIA